MLDTIGGGKTDLIFIKFCISVKFPQIFFLRNDTFFPGSFVAAPPDGPTALGVNFPRINVFVILMISVRHSPHITKTILEGGLGAAVLVLSHDHGLRHFWPLGWTSGWRGHSCAYWIHKVDLESDDRGKPTLVVLKVLIRKCQLW